MTIWERREQQGLGLCETARLAGIDPAQLSKVERGTCGISVEKLYALANVLEMRQLASVLEQSGVLR